MFDFLDSSSKSVDSIDLISDVPFDRALLWAITEIYVILIRGSSLTFIQNILIVWNIRLNVKDDFKIYFKIFHI